MQAKVEHVSALLDRITQGFAPAAFASSLSIVDMVLLDLIDRRRLKIDVYTLDTGRLHDETYALMQRVRARYKTRVHVVFPERRAVEAYVAANGPNAFYDSIMLRQSCCEIRKVGPLKRVLAGKRAWITGLRREQSPTRRDLPLQEFDTANGLEKFNPLADWSTEDVWSYIRHHEVPFNPLQETGFVSLGCAPCTRAIAAGDDIRAGRWWWEDPAHKECGLHKHKKTA